MAFTEANWDAYVPLTVAQAKVAATMPDGGESGFPCVLVIDQANSVNYEGDAANIFTTVNNYQYDIAIVQTDGSTQLKHDIVEWNAADGSRLLVCHILIPSLASASDTTIRLYYRDDGAADQQQTVYLASDNWVAYYGLHESAAGTGTADVYKDLTDNNNHCDDEVSDAGQTGQVGAGQEFDGNDDYITAPASASFESCEGNQAITISWWAANLDPAQTSTYFISYRPMNEWTIIYGYNTREWEFFTHGGSIRHTIDTLAAGDTAWHRYAFMFDDAANKVRGYSDGTETLNTNEFNILPDQSATDFYIGQTGGGSGFIEVQADEVGISNTARSKEWEETTNNCQDDNGAFWTVGSEQDVVTAKLHGFRLTPGRDQYRIKAGKPQYRIAPGRDQYRIKGVA